MTAKAATMSLNCPLASELFLACAALSPQKLLVHLQALSPAAALPELRAAHLQVSDDKSESNTKRMMRIYAARERLSVFCVWRSVRSHDEIQVFYLSVFQEEHVFI